MASRAVQAGTRPADHLDALDQLHRQILERGEAGAGRADLDAVDQHQHMVGLGAAQEQRGVLAETAVVRQRHAGYLAQQLRHAARLAALDILAVDDAHRRQALGSGLGGTGGGHHLVGKADRFGQAQEDAPHSATAAGVRKTLFMLCAAPSLSPARPGLRQTEDEATAGDVRQRPPRCRGCVRPVSGLASEALDASSRAFPCRSTVVIERLSDSPTVAGQRWPGSDGTHQLPCFTLRGTCRKARSLVVRGLRGQCGRPPQN